MLALWWFVTGEKAMKASKLGLLVPAFVTLALGACATATVIPVGNARAPIDPSQVRVDVQPPPRYEVLGILDGNAGIEGTGQGAVNDVITKLKQEAAKLGANGVLIGKTGQQYSGSFGGANYLGWGAFIGSSSATYSKTVSARAIYVGPDAPARGVTQPQTAASNGPVVSSGWPLPMPQFDTYGSCHDAGGDVTACQASEHAAQSWVATHATSVQVAGYCTSVAQSVQSYAMLESCVQQREGTH
jgi:hypothetical protein